MLLSPSHSDLLPVDDRGRALERVNVDEILAQYRGTPVPPTFSLGPAVRMLIGIVVLSFIGWQSLTASAGAAPTLWTPLFGIAMVFGVFLLAWNTSLPAANLTGRFAPIWKGAAVVIGPLIGVGVIAWLLVQARNAGPGAIGAIICYALAGVALAVAIRREAQRRPPTPEPGMLPRSRWLRVCAIVYLTSTWVVFSFADPTSTPTQRAIWYPVALGAVQTLTMVLIDRHMDRRRAFARFDSPVAKLRAWLAAHNACGACGYRLDDSPAEPDGMRMCPECGAAWHKDRVTHPAPQPDEPQRLERLLALRMDVGGVTDCRGVPLRRPMPRRMDEWLEIHRLDAAAKSKLEAVERRLYAKRFRSMRRIAFPVSLALVAFLCWAIVRDPERWPQVMMVGFLLAAMLAFVFYRLVSLADLPPDIALRVSRRGICPGCARPLPPRERAQFDGCVCCEACGLAWKARPRGFDVESPASVVCGSEFPRASGSVDATV